MSSNNLTEIQQFYSNKVIFMTGATGFLGRLLIEKLLRTCPDVQRIYILVRVTNAKLSDRLSELFDDQVFNVLRKLNPKFCEKVTGVAGDMVLPNLGLSSTDQRQLKDTVQIIFHSAASTNYNMKLSKAIDINLRGTLKLLELARTWSKVQCFMYCSSVAAFYDTEFIEDKLYPNINPPVSWRDILEDKKVDEKQQFLLGNAPNTYVYTKRQCENMVSELKRDVNLNIGIIRPGAFMCTAYEPEPGWLGNVGIAEKLFIGVILGLLRVLNLDPKSSAVTTPTDMLAHATLVSAWHTYRTNLQRPGSDICVYTYCTPTEQRNMGEMFKNISAENMKNPLPGIISTNVLIESDPKTYSVLNFLLNKLPGYLGQLFYEALGVPSSIKLAVDRTQFSTKILSKAFGLTYNVSCPNINKIWGELSTEDKKLWLFHLPNLNMTDYDRLQFVVARKLAEKTRVMLQNSPQVNNSKL